MTIPAPFHVKHGGRRDAMAVKPRPPLSPEAFQALTGVSDDTLARLAAYVKLLGK